MVMAQLRREARLRRSITAFAQRENAFAGQSLHLRYGYALLLDDLMAATSVLLLCDIVG